MNNLSRQSKPVTAAPQHREQPWHIFRAYVLIGIAVFLGSRLGIWTRPVEQLALFWPANGLLLSIFILAPRYASLLGIASAIAGYLAADLLFGSPWSTALWLTGANLAGVLAGYGCFRAISRRVSLITHPAFMLYLMGICTMASVAAALIGTIAGHYIFGEAGFHTLGFWFATELLNYLIVAPLIINLISLRDTVGPPAHARQLSRLWPIVALLIAHAASFALPGPGVVAYPIAALVWCAIVYDQRYTVVLSTLSTCWLAIAIPSELVSIGGPVHLMNESASFRLGLAQMLVVPLVVGSLSHAWSRMQQKLMYTAAHDSLTGLLSRGAFLRAGAALLQSHEGGNRGSHGLGALMIDIDHFKNVNDSHGHAAGDQVIVHVARTIAQHVRHGDVLGRLGGEEFAIIMANVTSTAALRVAERILFAVRQGQVERGDNPPLSCTVSIGIGVAHTPEDIEHLLHLADGALYEAKRLGRNRVESAVQ